MGEDLRQAVTTEWDQRGAYRWSTPPVATSSGLGKSDPTSRPAGDDGRLTNEK